MCGHTAESCGVGRRRGSDPALLWLWCRPAETAPIRSLAWEPPYDEGAALKKDKKKKRERERDTRGEKNDQDKPPTRPLGRGVRTAVTL